MGGLTICVFCASSTRIDARYIEHAGRVGAELAGRGHRLVSGGGSISSMGAVAQAARAAGAHTTGVIPQALVDLEVADGMCQELIVTPDMRSRKAEMDRRADGFLVLPGGIGTLEELFEIWTARTLDLHDRPVVVLDAFEFFAPLRQFLAHMHQAQFIRPHAMTALYWTEDIADAFDHLEGGALSRSPSDEPAA